MKTIIKKQNEYYIKPINAIITKHTMIPGISGKKINLNKSYQKMKSINEFRESLLVFDDIKPNKTIKNIYDKVIISGNPKLNRISLLTSYNNNYCYTESLIIKKECIQNNKYTILIHKITHNYLNEIKDKVQNGIVFFLDINNIDEMKLIQKYLKNNNFEIVPIDKLIEE